MNKILKHSVALIIAVTLVAGPVLFGFQEKARADTAGCLSSAAAAIGLSKTTSIIGVPVQNPGVDVTAGETTGSLVQRCIIEPLVTILARALLDNFTAQTVRWINSGFQGSPLYVTNLQGFMSGVADEAVGQYIAGLGPIGQILCSPFDLQLRLSLSLQYSSSYYQQIGCRLTDIQQNVQRAFTGGTFGANGWDNWIQMTGTPQNNPYGAFLIATDNIDNQIANKINNQITQLNWGKGFLSSTDPLTGRITTPGSLIEDQLSNTLGQSVRNVGLAKDIDAILGALVGQMINQVMGGLGGLAGGGGSSNYTGYSQTNYTSYSGTNYASGALTYNSQAQNLQSGLYIDTAAGTLGPTGGAGGPSPADFCAQFKKNIYGTADTNPTDTSLVSVKVNGTTDHSAAARPTTKTGGQWTLSDYNAVANFCNNVGLTASLSNTVSNTTNDYLGGLPKGTPAITAPTNQNLALNKPARQSSDYVDSYTTYSANKAVDGQTNNYYSSSITQGGGNSWWTVDLQEVKTINHIDIFRWASRSVGKCLIISQSPFGSSAIPYGNCAGLNQFPIIPSASRPISIATGNILGRYIWVQQSPNDGDNLILSDVQVFGPSQDQAGGAAPRGPVLSFSPSDITLDASYNPSNRNFQNTFALSANQTQNNLKARLSLFRVPSSGADQPYQFTSVFANNGTFKVNDTSVDISRGQNSVVLNQNFSISQGDSVTETEAGMISSTPAMNSADYPSYKIVMDILDSSNNPVATQTTTFKIQ